MNVASFPSVCSFLCSNDQQMLRGSCTGAGWGGVGVLNTLTQSGMKPMSGAVVNLTTDAARCH